MGPGGSCSVRAELHLAVLPSVSLHFQRFPALLEEAVTWVSHPWEREGEGRERICGDLPVSAVCWSAAGERRMPAGRSEDGDSSGGCRTAASGRAARPTLGTMMAWGVVLLMAGRRGAEACPAPCSCLGNTVDCHGLGIHSVPKNIPRGTERL